MTSEPKERLVVGRENQGMWCLGSQEKSVSRRVW